MRKELVNEDLVQVKELQGQAGQLILKSCWQRRLRHRAGIEISSCVENFWFNMFIFKLMYLISYIIYYTYPCLKLYSSIWAVGRPPP